MERCHNGGCTRLATDQVVFNGATDWVELVFDFGMISETWEVGDEVVVTVAVPASSGDHPWVAYDTVATPSRLLVTG